MASTLRLVGLVASALGLLLLAPSASVDAHARFRLDKVLKPRTSSTGEKSGPCGVAGPTTDSTKRTVLVAGQDVLVEWEETINHPGWYRLAFSPDGLTQFDSNVLLDNIVDVQTGATPHLYSATVKVPDTLCDTCSLQLIQVMTDNTLNPRYYSCSDIRIVSSLDEGGVTDGAPVPEPSPELPSDVDGASKAIVPTTPTGLKVQMRVLEGAGVLNDPKK